MKRFACASRIVLVAAVACGGAAFASPGTRTPAASREASCAVQVSRPLGGTVVSVDANGRPDGKIRCGSRVEEAACGPARFASNEAVTLKVTPDDGFVFEEWAADCSGRQRTCTFEARGPGKRVVAIFAPAENTASASPASAAQSSGR